MAAQGATSPCIRKANRIGLMGNVAGDILGGVTKPTVPDWKDILLSDEQGKAIAANQAALPGAEALVSASNSFSQDQITKMLEQAIPGYSAMVGSASGNIESMLKGEIPTDVSNAVRMNSASRALSGGFGGSDSARNLTSRDLGLTSLDLTGKGISAAETWMQNMNSLFRPSMIDVSSMFVTPQQMFSDTFQNQEQSWNVQWLKNQIKAMGDPTWTAIGQFVGGIGDALASVALGSMGGNTSIPAGGGSGGGTAGGGMGSGGGLLGGMGGGSQQSTPSVFDSNYQWGGSHAIQGN